MTNVTRIQLSTAFRRLAAIQQRIESQPDRSVQVAVDELLKALDELRGAQEHFLEQRDAIEGLRAELREEREKYRQLFDTAPDIYLITDASLTILSANLAAAELFNISQRFLAGKSLSVFLSKDRGRFLAEAARLATAGESTTWAFAIRPRERASLQVEARVVTHATEEGLDLHWILRPAGA
jgi:PAS domain S-box-containing protein